MRTLIVIALLTTSQFANASHLSESEKDCLERNVYHEARGLSHKDWVRVAKVLLSRKKAFSKRHNFHAKSNNLCDLARSREYSSRIARPIRETKVFQKIRKALERVDNGGNELYFTSRRGKMYYK